MVGNVPFTASAGHQHREARGAGNRLPICHSGEQVEAGDDDCVVIKHDGAPLPILFEFPLFGKGEK